MKRIFDRFSLNFSWQTLFLGTVISAILYSLLEWLFIITKPSLALSLPLLQKTKLFLLSFSLIAGIGLLFIFILMLINFGLRHPLVKFFGMFLPAGITACLALLLFDNFTYTIFRFGISTSDGIRKVVYLLFFLWLVGYFLVAWASMLSKVEGVLSLRRESLFLFVLIIFIMGVLGYQPPAKVEQPQVSEQRDKLEVMPHILLITVDGVDANHMSVYGYNRDTTPFLRQLAARSLVAENAYTNSANTAGSIVSILTGRYPTTTRVLFPPHTLQGNDGYRHLPYILRSNGYKNIQYSFPYYVDAYALGIMEGFEYVNGSYIQESPYLTHLKKIFDLNTAHYIYELFNRIIDRLGHIFFINEMTNFQKLIPYGKTEFIPDSQKVEAILNTFLTSEQPVFIHLHWMGTHGPTFYPKNQVFSLGKDSAKQEEWDLDFYDDSILEFDTAVAQIVHTLEEHNLANKTILIITSDHGMKFTSIKRIPLIIHFSNDQHKGKILTNVQLIDIAPTLLDYLGISRPMWLEGASIFDKYSDHAILGFGPGTLPVSREDGWWTLSSIRPPFYGFQVITLISCDTWYRLNLATQVWEKGNIEGSTNNCDPYTDAQAFELIIQHLKERNFDISSIQDFSLIKK